MRNHNGYVNDCFDNLFKLEVGSGEKISERRTYQVPREELRHVAITKVTSTEAIKEPVESAETRLLTPSATMSRIG